jgi:hypothetical protein
MRNGWTRSVFVASANERSWRPPATLASEWRAAEAVRVGLGGPITLRSSAGWRSYRISSKATRVRRRAEPSLYRRPPRPAASRLLYVHASERMLLLGSRRLTSGAYDHRRRGYAMTTG